MARLAILTGAVLIMIGALGYFIPEAKSLTAWIPAAIGLLFIVFGVIGRREAMRKHMMHACVLVGLLAVGATATALPAAVRALQGEEVDRPAAAYSKSATALVCVFFLVLAIRSFIGARRARS